MVSGQSLIHNIIYEQRKRHVLHACTLGRSKNIYWCLWHKSLYMKQNLVYFVRQMAEIIFTYIYFYRKLHHLDVETQHSATIVTKINGSYLYCSIRRHVVI